MVEDAIKYIADNLKIRIDQNQKFGPTEEIKVSLLIGDVVISEDSCELPYNEFDLK